MEEDWVHKVISPEAIAEVRETRKLAISVLSNRLKKKIGMSKGVTNFACDQMARALVLLSEITRRYEYIIDHAELTALTNAQRRELYDVYSHFEVIRASLLSQLYTSYQIIKYSLGGFNAKKSADSPTRIRKLVSRYYRAPVSPFVNSGPLRASFGYMDWERLRIMR